jgi:hypothetical protein
LCILSKLFIEYACKQLECNLVSLAHCFDFPFQDSKRPC